MPMVAILIQTITVIITFIFIYLFWEKKSCIWKRACKFWGTPFFGKINAPEQTLLTHCDSLWYHLAF